jgi:site-specific DNA-adenine methylase
MCSYIGGKKKIAKQIHDAITKVVDQVESSGSGKYSNYLEPFLGMASVFRLFAKDGYKATGCDANKNIKLMWKAIKTSNRCPSNKCSREKFERLKRSRVHSAERGFYGVACSFGGAFFGAYANNCMSGQGSRSKLREAYNGLMKLKPDMRGNNVHLCSGKSYTIFHPRDTIVYCDPPYASSLGKLKSNNEHLNDFDIDHFWAVMRDWSKPSTGNLVFISEEHAPADFVPIWRTSVRRSVDHASRKRSQEKLFIHRSLYDQLHSVGGSRSSASHESTIRRRSRAPVRSRRRITLR